MNKRLLGEQPTTGSHSDGCPISEKSPERWGIARQLIGNQNPHPDAMTKPTKEFSRDSQSHLLNPVHGHRKLTYKVP